MTVSKTWSTRRKAIVLAAVCVLGAGGGVFAAAGPLAHPSFASEASSPERSTPGLAYPVLPPVQLTAAPADAATAVNPASPVTLKVGNGRIDRASLTSESGGSVDGTLSADGSSWTASGPLKFNSRYTYTYTVIDAAGRSTTSTRSFTTVSTANEADAAIYPLDGMKVGVAQPIQITFSEPVLNRDAVEKAIKITSTSGQPGEFHWFSNTMVRYRPENFWAANSTITMDMQLFGVDLGKGQIGNFNKKVTIHIGDKKTAIADATAHTFKAFINDQQVGEWPTTMGDTRFPSARGYLVLMEKYRVEHMSAASIGLKPGDPAYYGELDVNFATRLTPSGEFIHQATDSALPYIGKTNLSHGCIGLGPDGAQWVFDNMTAGDVVQVVNTEGDFAAFDDGYGDWNIPWAQYAN
ncbi:Ig-like domain-containing protein [Pseudarthrobacter sp. L19]|uniref:L,D-transpeptidase n=1 Tax=Pseudarthrobacter sp. L19 TaxID=3423951 RepID=UPI003D7B9CED